MHVRRVVSAFLSYTYVMPLIILVLFQIDSWWYYQGTQGGVITWAAKPGIFPDGIAGISEKTGWPIVAHNKYW